MDIEYTWLLYQGKNFRQFSLPTRNSLIGQFVHPVEGEGMGLNGRKGVIVIVAHCVFHFIRGYENLV